MNYPANLVIDALRVYDAMPRHPAFVDQVVMPGLKAQLEGFFSRVYSRDLIRVYNFQNALRNHWCDAMHARSLYHAQNLDCNISDNDKYLNFEWCLITGIGGIRHMQVELGLSVTEADARVLAHDQRMDAISNYVRHLDRGKQ